MNHQIMKFFFIKLKSYWAIFLLLISWEVAFSKAPPVSGIDFKIKTCESFKFKKNSPDANEQLKQVLDFQWTSWMEDYPEWATYVGFPGRNHLLSDRSIKAIEARKQLDQCIDRVLSTIPEDRLNASNNTTLILAKYKSKQSLVEAQFPKELLPIDQMSGLQIDLPDLLESAPQLTLRDYEDRISRLKSLPVQVDQTIELMKLGVDAGVVQVKFLMQKVPAQFQAITNENLADNPLLSSFKKMPEHFPDKARQSLKSEAEFVLKNSAIPALKKLQNYVENVYIPKCRESISWSSLPNGKKWYEVLVASHTTSSITAEEIHQIGLKEVERIKLEMDRVRDELKFKGSRNDFHQFLLSDQQFFFDDAKNLISEYRSIAKRIDPELPKLFVQLPRLTYGVRAMPDYKSGSAPTAYYMQGSLASGRAGYFEANTYDLKSRPRWEMEVLTAHEAVPGHHLQIALAQEMGELPEFRKNESYTAFIEGWGLYAESLGDQLGLYKDPYSKYGQLVYEMWRSVRLVVDTGMHSMGWSKEKALSYFMDMVPKSKIQSENEIDRYISWPGQALAYKVGQLKFLQLREMAKDRLKTKFDIRKFHDVVLKNGALPMDILEKKFKEWLDQEAAR